MLFALGTYKLFFWHQQYQYHKIQIKNEHPGNIARTHSQETHTSISMVVFCEKEFYLTIEAFNNSDEFILSQKADDGLVSNPTTS
jgi:hypothetical protein